ncbi:MAG: glycosyltransferase family 2 protein [Lachnospiraceae bacterium]|nr:glycosyltransferase family 2 protein [Lachnospiraceae bacterium]
MNCIAGIVTYNPDYERLEANVKAITKQVKKVVIIDNASISSEVTDKISFVYNTELIKNNKNMGMAYALNLIMKYAYDNGYEWVITLDQDSVCPENIIGEAETLIDDKSLFHRSLESSKIAMIVPVICESASGEICTLGSAVSSERYQEVKKCITSAAITNVGLWKKIRGFDSRLFIDYVDYDYAVRCIKAEYKIIRMNNVILDHHIGKSEYRKFLWAKVRVANHTPVRKYYIARNIVIYMRRYKKDINVPAEILRLFKVFALIVLYEDDKKEKLKFYFKGIKRGLNYKL